MSLSLALFDVSLWFGRNTAEAMCSQRSLSGGIRCGYPINVNVNFDHLVKMELPGFSAISYYLPLCNY